MQKVLQVLFLLWKWSEEPLKVHQRHVAARESFLDESYYYLSLPLNVVNEKSDSGQPRSVSIKAVSLPGSWSTGECDLLMEGQLVVEKINFFPLM